MIMHRLHVLNCLFQGVMSSAPDIIANASHMTHNHGSGGHNHAIDLEHPVLALSMTTLAISIKEGYVENFITHRLIVSAFY
jgi:hypothetical protein